MPILWLYRLRQLDWWLMGAMSLLLCVSLAIIASNDSNQFIKQLIFTIGSIFTVLVISQIDYRRWINYAYIIYIVGGLVLIAVLVFGIKINGTTGWFDLGAVTIQPVEFVKIILLITLARFMADHAFSMRNWSMIIRVMSFVIGYAILVERQPDLGSAVIFGLSAAIMILISPVRWKQLAVLVSIALLVAVVAWFAVLKDYQKDRLLTFIEPQRDPLHSGYNVRQAVIAVGSGEWFGRGLGLGTQSQLHFLPERDTDFIFAVIAEELGIIGGSAVIGLIGIILWRLWLLLSTAHDDYTKYYCIGLLSLIFFQSVVNIGMNLGIMPVTGIPLPFVSAGGSSLLALAVGIGIVQNCIIQTKQAN